MAATRAQEHLVLSGATDLAKLPEPADLHGADALGLARLLRPGCRPTGRSGVHVDELRRARGRGALDALTPETLDELLPAADRAPRAAEPERAAATSSRCSSSALLPAPRRSAGEPAELLGARGLPALRLPLLPASARSGCRAPMAPPGGRPAPAEPGMSALLRGSIVHGLLERLDFAAARRARRRRGGRGDRAHGVEAAARGRGRRARDGRAGGAAPGCASGSRPRARCAPSCPSRSRSRRPARAGARC